MESILSSNGAFDFIYLSAHGCADSFASEDEDDLPSNSDAVLTMSQFISAMKKFHSDHYHLNGWDIDGGGEWD